MNTEPHFTDSHGKAIKPPKDKVKRRRNEWTGPRIFVAVMMIVTITPLLFGAVTKVILTGGAQVQGILPVANGGTGTGSTLTGVMRGNSSAMTAAELSGDVTTSGSNAATVAKINGTSITTNSAADQTIVTTASATASYASIPNCPSGALQYSTSTHTFACGSVLTGTFSDQETPSGTINSSNTAFVFAHTPSPANSLTIWLNGVEQQAGGADYTLSTATATFGVAPPTGSTIVANYRY